MKNAGRRSLSCELIKGRKMIKDGKEDMKKACPGRGKIIFQFYMLMTFFFCILGQPLHICAQQVEVVDRIVAVVNDDIVTLMELKAAIKPYEKKIKTLGYTSEEQRKMLFKVREDKLRQLISDKLTEQEIKALEVTVDEKEVDDAVERIKESNFLTEEELRQALSNEGSSLEAYRNQLKDQILKSKLVNYKIKSKIVITKEDIKKYYNSHNDQYAGKKKYHLKNILMRVPEYAGDGEKEAIYEKMEKVLENLNRGSSFEDTARTYSELQNASNGGNLGLIAIDLFSETLQNAIIGLKAGEFTPILDTDQGFQIFFVENIVTTDGKSLEEATIEIEEKLYNQIVDEKFQTWLKTLQDKAHIKIIK